MRLNIKEWIGSVIASDKRIAIPIMTHSGIEILGKTVRDAVTDGSVHAMAVETLASRYPSAATSVIMDLTVEAEAFGAEISFSDHEVPSVTGRLVYDMETIENLAVPGLDKGRVPEYLKACRTIASKANRPVLAGCIGPYSLAGRLYDMSEIMMGIYIEPDSMKILLEKCTEFITSYCMALKEAGANGVLMAEPAAGLLSNEACSEFSSAFVKKIVEKVQDENFGIFLHNCGNTGQCTEAMVETGAFGYHFGNAINMKDALDKCPSDTLVMGNIDPVSVMKTASAEEVYAKTYGLLEQTEGYANFVLSTGCDTPPELPFANIDSFYKALADFNDRKK